jgi:hypothetical protein
MPALSLNFITGSLDPRITFNRTTGLTNPATYVDSSGFVVGATDNQPRFDYDPVTLAPKGLLIDEQRTNRLLRSEEFDDAAWTKNNSTTSVTFTVTGTAGVSGINSIFATATSNTQARLE